MSDQIRHRRFLRELRKEKSTEALYFVCWSFVYSGGVFSFLDLEVGEISFLGSDMTWVDGIMWVCMNGVRVDNNSPHQSAEVNDDDQGNCWRWSWSRFVINSSLVQMLTLFSFLAKHESILTQLFILYAEGGWIWWPSPKIAILQFVARNTIYLSTFTWEKTPMGFTSLDRWILTKPLLIGSLVIYLSG